jgi:hypothetical protein
MALNLWLQWSSNDFIKKLNKFDRNWINLIEIKYKNWSLLYKNRYFGNIHTDHDLVFYSIIISV